MQSQLAALLLRLMGVYCLIRSIETLSQGLVIPAAGQVVGSGWAFAAIVVSAAWLLVCAIALLRFAAPLGNLLATAPDPPEETSIGESSDRWMAVAFMVAGVVLVVWETPQPLLQAFVNLSIWRSAADSVARDSALDGALFLLGLVLVRVIMGVILVFGAKRIATAILRLRGFPGEKDTTG